jgi:hypothetical protein
MGLSIHGEGERAHRAAPSRCAQGRARHRLEGASAAVRALSPTRGTPGNRNKIVVAIARELAGFVWAIAQQVKPI